MINVEDVNKKLCCPLLKLSTAYVSDFHLATFNRPYDLAFKNIIAFFVKGHDLVIKYKEILKLKFLLIMKVISG
jgi:hypothetical protein